jgi:hypothetical protein
VPTIDDMCRNITTLRGLEPVATPEEIEAAARQYVRKISGVQKTSPATEAVFEAAVAEIAHISAHLLADLPPRKQPPPTLPPLRRLKVTRPQGAPARTRR